MTITRPCRGHRYLVAYTFEHSRVVKILAEGILPHKRRFSMMHIRFLSEVNPGSVGSLFVDPYIDVVLSPGIRILLSREAAAYFGFVKR